VRLVVQKNAAADDVRIRAELFGPEDVAQHHNLMLAELIFLREERPAEGGFNAKNVKIMRRDTAGAK